MAKQDETPAPVENKTAINRRLYKRGDKIPLLKFKDNELGNTGIRHPRFGDLTNVHFEGALAERTSKAVLNDDFNFNGNFCTVYLVPVKEN